MNLSIGICISLDTNSEFLLHQLISVYNLVGVKYKEVILCGQLNDACWKVAEGFSSNVLSIKYIPYEGPPDKPGHITKKKNMIADIAFFDNLVVMHDYLTLPSLFAEHMPVKFEVYVPPIHNLEGTRHADWMINPEKLQYYINCTPGIAASLMTAAPHENAPKYVNALPYSVKYMTPIQYISGGFICCKTEIMRDNPFNENLYWGDAEDLEWSERIVAKYGLKTTAWDASVQPVKILKPNKWAVTVMPDHIIKGLKEFYGL